jgi:hypothetical protein
VNCLLQAKTVHVDCRGLESALEAVRVSLEALRCFRGLKVPVEVVREPVGILEHIKTFWFCFKVFRSNGNVLGCFKVFRLVLLWF